MIKLNQYKKLSLSIIIVLFFATRIFIACWYQTPGSDTGLYGNYAIEFRQALDNKNSVYEIHNGAIEYPPLALGWMYAPMVFVGSNAQPDGYTGDAFYSWKKIFKLFYLVFDASLFAILLLLLFKPIRFLEVEVGGLFIYFLSGLLLFNFLYDRQDLFLGGIVFLSFLLLVSRRHWMIPLFVLAIGINFKLIPLLLVPIFIIGSLPVCYARYLFKNLFKKDLLLEISKRFLFLIIATVLIFLPFYLWGGRSTFDFLSYHSDRGLQLESTYSSFLIMLNYLGFPVYVTHGFGAFNIESSIAPFFVKISTFLIVVGVLGILVFLCHLLKHFSDRVADKEMLENDSLNLAQCYPQMFLCLTLATLLMSIVASKVLSPQYILWLVPLFGLLSFRNKYAKIAGCLFVATCLFTTPIFPYLYFTNFVHGQQQLADGSVVWAAPTLLAGNILFVRNLLLIGTAIMLVYASKSTNKKINPIDEDN